MKEKKKKKKRRNEKERKRKRESLVPGGRGLSHFEGFPIDSKEWIPGFRSKKERRKKGVGGA